MDRLLNQLDQRTQTPDSLNNMFGEGKLCVNPNFVSKMFRKRVHFKDPNPELTNRCKEKTSILTSKPKVRPHIKVMTKNYDRNIGLPTRMNPQNLLAQYRAMNPVYQGINVRGDILNPKWQPRSNMYNGSNSQIEMEVFSHGIALPIANDNLEQVSMSALRENFGKSINNPFSNTYALAHLDPSTMQNYLSSAKDTQAMIAKQQMAQAAPGTTPAATISTDMSKNMKKTATSGTQTDKEKTSIGVGPDKSGSFSDPEDSDEGENSDSDDDNDPPDGGGNFSSGTPADYDESDFATATESGRSSVESNPGSVDGEMQDYLRSARLAAWVFHNNVWNPSRYRDTPVDDAADFNDFVKSITDNTPANTLSGFPSVPTDNPRDILNLKTRLARLANIPEAPFHVPIGGGVNIPISLPRPVAQQRNTPPPFTVPTSFRPISTSSTSTVSIPSARSSPMEEEYVDAASPTGSLATTVSIPSARSSPMAIVESKPRKKENTFFFKPFEYPDEEITNINKRQKRDSTPTLSITDSSNQTLDLVPIILDPSTPTPSPIHLVAIPSDNGNGMDIVSTSPIDLTDNPIVSVSDPTTNAMVVYRAEKRSYKPYDGADSGSNYGYSLRPATPAISNSSSNTIHPTEIGKERNSAFKPIRKTPPPFTVPEGLSSSSSDPYPPLPTGVNDPYSNDYTTKIIGISQRYPKIQVTKPSTSKAHPGRITVRGWGIKDIVKLRKQERELEKLK